MILDSSYFSYALDEIVIMDSGQIGKMGMRTTDALQVYIGVQANVGRSVVG